MFDGEIVKKKFPFEKNFGLRKCSPKKSKRRSKKESRVYEYQNYFWNYFQNNFNLSQTFSAFLSFLGHPVRFF